MYKILSSGEENLFLAESSDTTNETINTKLLIKYLTVKPLLPLGCKRSISVVKKGVFEHLLSVVFFFFFLSG